MTGLKKAAALRNKHLPEPEKLLRRGKAATCQPSPWPSTGGQHWPSQRTCLSMLDGALLAGDHRVVRRDWKIIIIEIFQTRIGANQGELDYNKIVRLAW
ncbi:hypothetical protein T11_3873 [Trichinella zimbabwensis]|uniref:Uncharacterized protein n=1 Tax=Trichinella zimbabwensis TaxID=268475 RepID=A0A0V1GVW1_9BILA|nr:hypothetical protein T11_3873 [Trichinella zimbabwensis]